MFWRKNYKKTFHFDELKDNFPAIKETFDVKMVSPLLPEKEIFAITFFEQPFSLNFFIEFIISGLEPEDDLWSSFHFFHYNNLKFEINLKSKELLPRDLVELSEKLNKKLENSKDFNQLLDCLNEIIELVSKKINNNEFNHLKSKSPLDEKIIDFSKLFWINLFSNEVNITYEKELAELEKTLEKEYLITHACSLNQLVKYLNIQNKCFNNRRIIEDIKYVKATGSKEHKEYVLSLQIEFENQLKEYNSFLYCNVLHNKDLNSYTRNKLASLYEKNHINFRLNFNLNAINNKKNIFSLNDSMNIPWDSVSKLLRDDKIKEVVALFNTRYKVKSKNNDYSFDSIFSSYYGSEDKTKLAIELITEELEFKDLINIEISVKNTFFDFMGTGKYMTKEGYLKVYQIIKLFKEKNINFKVYYLGDLNKDTNYFLEFIERTCKDLITPDKTDLNYYLWNYKNHKFLIKENLKVVFENKYIVISLSDNDSISVYKREKKELICIWSNIIQNKKLKKEINLILTELEYQIDKKQFDLKNLKNFLNYLEINKFLIS